MRTEHQSQEFTRRMSLDLDEAERFEVTVRGKRALVVGMTLRWSRYGFGDDTRQQASWDLRALNIRKDGSLGAAKRFSSWDTDEPQCVTKALTDLAPEWFE